MSYYPNLVSLLEQRRISAPMLAKVIGVSDKSALDKIKGLYDFKLDEAKKVMTLFPEYSFDFVFAKGERPVKA